MRTMIAAVTTVMLLTSCATTMGAGCEVYRTARPDLPRDALDGGPLSVWVGNLDDGMTEACT